MLNTKDNLINFDSNVQKCIMLEYSKRSKCYKVYNNKTQTVEESIHVKFDDKLDSKKSKLDGKFADLGISYSGSEDKDFGDAQQKLNHQNQKILSHQHL